MTALIRKPIQRHPWRLHRWQEAHDVAALLTSSHVTTIPKSVELRHDRVRGDWDDLCTPNPYRDGDDQ